jgi:hypothetical protein
VLNITAFRKEHTLLCLTITLLEKRTIGSKTFFAPFALATHHDIDDNHESMHDFK